jgi:hypothetical protein
VQGKIITITLTNGATSFAFNGTKDLSPVSDFSKNLSVNT